MLAYPKVFSGASPRVIHTTILCTERTNTMCWENRNPERTKRSTPGNTSRDNHVHLLIPSSAQTEITSDCKNPHTRKLPIQRYLKTRDCFCMTLYDIIQRNKTVWRYIHIQFMK